jgi:cytochrome d ubiquinol oxidase subunit I
VAFLSFPSGFIAVLAGWFTAEVGRQPWVVYGLLRTKDAVTPSLTTGDVLFSLACYVIAYATIFGFGLFSFTDFCAMAQGAMRRTGRK